MAEESTPSHVENLGDARLHEVGLEGMEEEFHAFMDEISTGDVPGDINALVQSVMRQAYMENTEDLQFFANKMKYFNEMKKAVREHVADIRELSESGAGVAGDEASGPAGESLVAEILAGAVDTTGDDTPSPPGELDTYDDGAQDPKGDKEDDQPVANRPLQTDPTEPSTKHSGDTDASVEKVGLSKAADVATGADGAAAPFIPGGGVLGAVMGGRGTENLAASSGNSEEDDPPDAGPLPEAADPTGRGTIGAPAEQPEVRIPGARDDDDGGDTYQETAPTAQEQPSQLTSEADDERVSEDLGGGHEDDKPVDKPPRETDAAGPPKEAGTQPDPMTSRPTPEGKETGADEELRAPMTLEEAIQEQPPASAPTTDDLAEGYAPMPDTFGVEGTPPVPPDVGEGATDLGNVGDLAGYDSADTLEADIEDIDLED